MVSVSFCRVSSETSCANQRIPARRANGRLVVAGALGEARADDDVGLAALERREQVRDLLRVVLAVAVEPDHGVVAVRERVLEAGLDGAADAEVEGQADDRGAGGGRARGRRVLGAVVDHDDVEAGSNARSSSTTPATASSSLRAGTIAMR